MPVTPDKIASLNDQITKLSAEGKIEEAISIARELVEIQTVQGSQPSLAQALNNLGALDWKQGRMEEAWKEFEEALQIRRELAQKNPETYLPDVATTLNNLGVLDRDQNRPDEARKEFAEALQIRRELAQKKTEVYRPDVAATLNNLGLLDRDQGRMEEAWKEFAEALQTYRELAQKNPETYQPDVARTLNNLGLLSQKTGRFEEAISLFKEAVDIDQAGFGPEHPATLNSLKNLALVCLDMGRYDEALSVFKRVLAIQEKILGPDHPDTARTLKNLALLREKTEDSERDKRAESIQKVAGESAEHATVPFDLERYHLSWGAEGILIGVGQVLGPMSTSAVLLEMAEQGRPGRDPQWSGDFLRQSVAAYPAKYLETIAWYRELKTARGKADAPAAGASMMMPGLAWSLECAQKIATQTTSERKISGRHLLAALIIEPPQPYTLGAQRELEAIGIDVPLLRQRLYEWVRGYGDNDVEWRAVLVGASAEPLRRAEFAADSATGPDLLDIGQDVLSLATLIAARDTSPPLSIGLFGDWGSGKTFFMGQLRSAIAQLSKQARDAKVMQRELPFYKRIVQIEFNAWHYVEGNLWASMVDHILDNLRISDEQSSTVTKQLQEHWIKKLDFVEKAKIEAVKKTEEADAKVKAAEQDVADAEKTQDEKNKELQRLSIKNIARDFQLSDAFPIIVKSLEPLGFKPLSAAVTELESSLRQARSVVERGNAALTPLLRKDRWRSLLIILLGAPAAAAVIGWVLTWLGAERIAQVSAFAAGAAGLLGGGAKWLRDQAQWMSEHAKKVEQAQRTYDEALAKERADTAEETAKMKQEFELAKQNYALAKQRADESRRELDAARAELAAATTSRLLGQFVQDRAASSDYRKHLGVLAVVRQDFQKLSELIEEDNWQLAADDPKDKRFGDRLNKITTLDGEAVGADKRINRIVLYIDDLDRCPPAKVVEVLQAVHLLLAFPLFVVVVGVDARWISRSLETRYRELLHVGNAEEAVDITQMFGVARSEDYLEKIFQIPLWLRTMDANSARRMVHALFRNGPGTSLLAKSLQDQATVVTNAVAPGPQQNVAPSNQAGSAGQQASVPAHITPTGRDVPQATATPVATTSTPTPIVPNLESLHIRDFEQSAIDVLSPLLGRSPRALKRFVNLYRLIKAGLTPTEHNAFVRQNEKVLGDYEAVLFLLAVDTGLPRVSRAVFDVLLDSDTDNMNVKQLIETIDKHDAASTSDWATLRAWMTGQQESERFNQGMPRLANWVLRVSRYSFQAAHLEKSRDAPSRRKDAVDIVAPGAGKVSDQ